MPTRARLLLFCIAVFINLTNAIFADEPAKELPLHWISPKGTYTAQLELVMNATMLRLTVGPSKEDKTVIPLLEQFDFPMTDIWSPVAKGFWNANEDHFSVFWGRAGNLVGVDVVLQPSVVLTPGDKVRPQFVISKRLNQFEWTQDGSEQDAQDLILDLYPQYSNFDFSKGGVTLGGWIGDDEAHLQFHDLITSFEMKDDKRTNVFEYDTQRDVVWKLTADGGKVTTIGSPHVVKTDKQTNDTVPFTLPQKTPTDELRSAVRANNVSEVQKLLTAGARPNAATAAQSPLSIAIGHENVDIVSLLIQAGAKSGDIEVSMALNQYNPVIFDKIFDSKPELTNEEVYGQFSSLFFGPPQAFKSSDQWQKFFEHVIDRYSQLGVNFNAQDPKTGDTILIEGLNKHVPIAFLEKLIKAGANPALKNHVGETASDVAAKLLDIPALRILDRDGSHATLVKEYTIPPLSSFLGPWTEGGYIATVTLNPDASGTFASMFGGDLSWKQADDLAYIQIHVRTRSGDKLLTATGRLSGDGKTLLIKFTGDAAQTMGANEQKFEKGDQQ